MSLTAIALATTLQNHEPFPSTTWLPRMAENEITIMDIAISKNNKIAYSKTLGSTENPVFQVGFISRIPGLIVFLQLVDENKINLESPITNYLPQNTNLNSNFKDPIKVKHLLEANSGYQLYKYPGYTPANTPKTLIQELTNYYPSYPPGTRTQSSSINETAIQLICENVTKKPLQQLAQERVFTPLNITQSQYSLLPPKGQTLAKGNKPMRVYPQANAQGLYTTATDIATMMNEILACATGKPNGLLKPKTALKTITPNKDGKTYGFNIDLNDPSKTYFLGGQNPGYSCQARFRLTPHPQTIVVLTNTDMGWNLINQALNTGFDFAK